MNFLLVPYFSDCCRKLRYYDSKMGILDHFVQYQALVNDGKKLETVQRENVTPGYHDQLPKHSRKTYINKVQT